MQPGLDAERPWAPVLRNLLLDRQSALLDHPAAGGVVEPTERSEGDVETCDRDGGLDVLGRWRSLGLDRP